MASKLNIWLMAFRLKTLWAAVTPVLVGTVLAAKEGYVDIPVTVAIFAAAILIQVGANLANDVYDFLNGADTAERLGPKRVTESGLLSPMQVKRGMVVIFASAIMIGFYLAWVGGWPIVAIGLLSIAMAIAYTGGPWPLGYHGLGDVAVFLFFGIIALYGTVYLLAGQWLHIALWGAIPMGSLATAILVVNNYRDHDTDLKAGKRTLAVRMGRAGAKTEYVLLLVIAYLVPALYWLEYDASPLIFLPLITLPLAWVNIRSLSVTTGGAALNTTLAKTAGLQLVYGILYSVGLML